MNSGLFCHKPTVIKFIVGITCEKSFDNAACSIGSEAAFLHANHVAAPRGTLLTVKLLCPMLNVCHGRLPLPNLALLYQCVLPQGEDATVIYIAQVRTLDKVTKPIASTFNTAAR